MFTSIYNMKLYAYLIYALEFEKFYKCGLQALKVYYYIKVFSNIQARNPQWMPVKGNPSWVKLTNKQCKLDSKSKHRAIKKLESAGLIEVKRNPKFPKTTPLLKIVKEIGKSQVRDQSKLRFGGTNKKEFKFERAKK